MKRGKRTGKKGTVITGTIGSDTHVIGTRMIQYALEQEGFDVISLGAFVLPEEFIGAAKETNADAIFVSSIYGMAELDCEGFGNKCIESGLKDIILYLGGNITTQYRADGWADIEAKFKSMGFHRVYPPGTLPKVAIADLKKDLGLRKR